MKLPLPMNRPLTLPLTPPLNRPVRRRRVRSAVVAFAVVAVGATAVGGCSAQSSAARPELKVTGGYVPQPPLSDMAAGYFTVRNTGKAADKLTSVTSDAASDVTLMTTTSNGVMRGVTGLSIPAGGRLVLGVGHDHLMLMGLKGKPTVGQKVSFQLRFATSSPITVRVPVEPAAYQPKG